MSRVTLIVHDANCLELGEGDGPVPSVNRCGELCYVLQMSTKPEAPEFKIVVREAAVVVEGCGPPPS